MTDKPTHKELAKLEEALRESEERFRTMIESAHDIIWTLDLQGNVTYINRRGEEISNYKISDIIGKEYSFKVLEEDLPKVQNAVIQTLQGKPQSFEARIYLSNDTILFLSVNQVPLYQGGKVSGAVCFGRDITERKKAENALRLQSEIMENLAEGINLIKASDGIIIYANPKFEAMFGYEPGEIIGKHISIVNAPTEDDPNETARKIIDSLTKTGEWHGEVHNIKKDGTTFWCYANVSVFDHHDFGKVFISVHTDITKRKEAESAVKLHEIRLQSMLNLYKMYKSSEKEIMDFVTDEINKITQSKAGFTGLLSQDESVFTLHAYSTGVMKECATEDKPINFTVKETGFWAEAVRHRKPIIVNDYQNNPSLAKKGCPVGHVEIIRFVSIPVFDGEKIVALGCVANKKDDYKESDVNALNSMLNNMWRLILHKRAEDEKNTLWMQLLQSQKMESIGRLTGGVAHDFNNMLTAIIGYSEMALRRISDVKTSKMIKTVLDASDNAARLVQQMLAFSRKQVLNRRLNNFNLIIDDISDMLVRMIGEDIKLKINTTTEVSNVMVDEGQIQQILMNLVVNARDAMPKGGKLTIETQDIEIDESYAKNHPGIKTGPYVMISISDTGVGMSKEVQKKIFEPFFTTKDIGKGTGLGLAMVYGIVKQHDGYIEVCSEKGIGTTFKIYIPVAKGDVIELKKVELPITRSGHETILIVDDEDTIREYLNDLLTPLGYTILLAESGEEALQIADNTKMRIDLLFTDIVMTGMNGWELYEKIKKTRPDIKPIFSSGYMGNKDIHNNIQKNKLPFMSKPIKINDLLNKIKEVLG